MATNTLPQTAFLNESDREFLKSLAADLDMQEMEKKYPEIKMMLTSLKPVAKNLFDALLIDPDRTEKINQMNIRGEISD